MWSVGCHFFSVLGDAQTDGTGVFIMSIVVIFIFGFEKSYWLNQKLETKQTQKSAKLTNISEEHEEAPCVEKGTAATEIVVHIALFLLVWSLTFGLVNIFLQIQK